MRDQEAIIIKVNKRLMKCRKDMRRQRGLLQVLSNTRFNKSTIDSDVDGRFNLLRAAVPTIVFIGIFNRFFSFSLSISSLYHSFHFLWGTVSKHHMTLSITANQRK